MLHSYLNSWQRYDGDHKNEETHKVNSLNHLVSNYSYDKNGNPIIKYEKEGNVYYKYDALDRLIEITKPQQYRYIFSYDSFHRRLTNTCYKWNDDSWQKEYTHNYLYDDQNEIGAYDDNDKIIQLRVLGVINHAEIGASIGIEVEKENFIPIHDIFGNITSLISLENKDVVESYHHSSFGEEVISKSSDNNKLINPWRFSSKRTDDTGLVYYGRRYYEPQFGRWVTPDPKGYTDSMNIYAFVLNDPLINFDLYGLITSNQNYDHMHDWKHPYSWGDKNQTFVSHHVFKDSESKVYDLSDRPNLKNGHIVFINGIMTNKEQAEKHAKLISDMAGGVNVSYVHNASHGFYQDIAESSYGRSHLCTTPVALIQKLLTDIFNQKEKVKNVQVVCHSQGSIHMENALLGMKEEHRNRVIVLAIAPARFIKRKICLKAFNYTSERDPIPKVMSKLFDSQDIKNSANITVLKPRKDISRFSIIDHSFDSPTYKEAIDFHIKRYLKNPGGVE